MGIRELRFHDLRHSGLTWSAATGASIAELMRRAGHASQTAAMRYQHATDDRDRVLAHALADLASRAGEQPVRSPTDAKS
ncbi:MAG: tyrosine-type recombinase/integrase [Acidimicrobiales bacterium]|nr:tyrosine-type recombinase/integrase [Acidimicrobiales bacterium]